MFRFRIWKRRKYWTTSAFQFLPERKWPLLVFLEEGMNVLFRSLSLSLIQITYWNCMLRASLIIVSVRYRKTTITRLLYRFYNVQEGSITLDGHDLRNIKLESLRKNIGVVPQVIHFFLFNDLQHFLC
jgi:hypothetical protein